MLPESPTFYKVTCLISMCCSATLVLLLVCVQPQNSLRFKRLRGHQLRALAPENIRHDPQRDNSYFRGTNFDIDDKKVHARQIPDDSNAQLVRAVMSQNAILAKSLQCKLVSS